MRKKKFEFSKFLVTWALVLTSVCVLISYTLAFLDHETCSDITTSIASACIAIGVAYQAKSFGEKNSRNKYRLDENGMPLHEDDEGEG